MPKEKAAFKRSLFGLSGKDIYKYLDEVSRRTAQELKNKDEALEELGEMKIKLEGENRALAERVKALEEERGYISSAIVRAENEAANILDNATQEAQIRKNQLEAGVKEQVEKLEEAKAAVLALKTAARDIVREYEQKLEGLVGGQSIEQE